MNSFDHERLDAYRVAREMHRELHRQLRAAPRARQDLVDQARRSAASVVLNIAEAAGEWSPKEKAKFYRFAKRSATELAATLDLLADVRSVSEQDLAPMRALLERTFAMLVKLAKASEPKPGARRTSSRGP